MKYTVTDLETQNQSLGFPQDTPETYCFDNFFGNFPAQIAHEENKSPEESIMCLENKHNDAEYESERT